MVREQRLGHHHAPVAHLLGLHSGTGSLLHVWDRHAQSLCHTLTSGSIRRRDRGDSHNLRKVSVHISLGKGVNGPDSPDLPKEFQESITKDQHQLHPGLNDPLKNRGQTKLETCNQQRELIEWTLYVKHPPHSLYGAHCWNLGVRRDWVISCSRHTAS